MAFLSWLLASLGYAQQLGTWQPKAAAGAVQAAEQTEAQGQAPNHGAGRSLAPGLDGRAPEVSRPMVRPPVAAGTQQGNLRTEPAPVLNPEARLVERPDLRRSETPPNK